MKRAATLAVLLAAAAAGRAAEIASGALVSSDGRVVYSRVPPGALEARSPEGALLWRADDDLRPLADRGGRLLAQRGGPEGRLDLVFLDTATGRRLGEATVALPPRVASPLDERLGTRFDLEANPDGQRTRLVWTFERRPVRGAHFEAEPRDGEEGGAVVRLAGALSVDLDAQRAEVVPSEPPSVAVQVPATAGALRGRPLRIGTSLVATAGAADRPVLVRWNAAGEALPPVALPAGVVLQCGSADGRHVLLSREISGAPPAKAHEWTVIALETGDVRVTLRTSVAAAPFEVSRGHTLVALEAWGHSTPSGWRDEPRRLQAFGPSGASIWSWPLQDPAYRGPVAP
ncbi:MAG: hypothetical protein ABW221_23640 [Vicinamibacteria bacterium]